MTLTELRRLAEAATPGPWWRSKERISLKDDVGTVCYTRCVSDAMYFMALEPERVLALLDVIEAAKAMRSYGERGWYDFDASLAKLEEK